jgi:hypothetical protein
MNFFRYCPSLKSGIFQGEMQISALLAVRFLKPHQQIKKAFACVK